MSKLAVNTPTPPLAPPGLRVYDIANIDNKDFSQRMITAPVSPIGQRFFVPTKNAAAIASPTTLGVDPLRQQLPENEEQPIHLLYGFLYVADREEGLVVIGNPNLKSSSPGVGTLLDGNPANNFLKRSLAFNPDGILTGAHRITIAGTYAYILTDKSLVVVDLDNPLAASRHRHDWGARLGQSSGNRRSVPLCLRCGQLRIEDAGRDRPRASKNDGERPRRAGRCPKHLRRPDLCLRCRREKRSRNL